MSKNVIVLRHGRKDGESISADQINEIEENGIQAINNLVKNQPVVIHYGSSYIRTKQTIKAFERFAEQTGLFTVSGYLHGDERFGNVILFSEFTKSPEMVAEANKTTWLNAFEKTNPLFIANVQSDMVVALRKLFSELSDGQTAITIGHTPMIEWLAFAFDKQVNIPRDLKLAELTGFIFTEEAGQIMISAKIGF